MKKLRSQLKCGEVSVNELTDNEYQELVDWYSHDIEMLDREFARCRKNIIDMRSQLCMCDNCDDIEKLDKKFYKLFGEQPFDSVNDSPMT